MNNTLTSLFFSSMTIHQLLSPSTNRRFFTLFRPASFEVRKIHETKVAFEQQWWLMSTAAPPENPDNGRTKRKIVSPNERRRMVQAYVDEYRAVNAGKFPTASNVARHVGGSYYKVRDILQEYEYGCRLPAVVTAAKTSTAGQIAPVCRAIDWQVGSDCQLLDDGTAGVEDCSISTELHASCKVRTDKNSFVSTLNMHHETTIRSVSGCERMADLELGEECDKSCADTDIGDKISILEVPEVPVTLNLLDYNLANETSMSLATDDKEILANSSNRPEVIGSSKNLEPDEIDKSADQDFESPEPTRCRVMYVAQSTGLSETQFGDPYSNSSNITQELDKSKVGAEMERTSAIGMTLGGQARTGGIATMNDSQVSIDNDRSSQVADDCSCQQLIDESVLTESKEVTVDDVSRKEKTVDLSLKRGYQKKPSTNVEARDCVGSVESEDLVQQQSSMIDTSVVKSKVASTGNCEVAAKPSLPSEVPGTLQNSDIDGTVESPQALKSGRTSRGAMEWQTADKQLWESSFWGSMKQLARNIMSFWRQK